MKVKIRRVEENMPRKILNTVRGSGRNINERAGQLIVKQYREHQRANRVSYAIKTDFSMCEDVKPRWAHRTMLWP